MTARDNDADIRKINDLRQRVKTAETAATTAKVHHDEAMADLEAARRQVKELGLNPDDPKKLDKWLDNEAAEIETLIERAEVALSAAQELVDGR